ncbi:MAG TPA: transglutaminase-like domain-containing protein [Gemmatimonadaceae bacterium]|nr:transglutaminase-like domain-containing protein [Gemmatimonadaceae bacterium]
MSRRGQVAAGILLLWVAGLAVLARRELFRPAAERLATAGMRVGPSASYFLVRQHGEQIGFASTTVDTTEASIVVSDYMVAELPVAGQYQRATATTRVTLTRAMRVRDFTYRIETASGPVEASGTMEGDSALILAISASGEPADTQRIRLPGPVLLPTLAPLAAVLIDRPRIGRSYTLAVFDPLQMRASELRMTIRAESLFVVTDSASLDRDTGRWVPALRDTIRAWSLVPERAGEESSPSPLHVSWWVDELGRVVEGSQAAGMQLERTAYELAFENWRLDTRERPERPTSARDILEATAIASDAALDRNRIERLRVRLEGIDPAGFDIDGGRQSLSGSVLTVTREDSAALRADYTLPMQDTAGFGRWLSAEPLIQVRHRSIVDVARELRGPHTDPADVAERINTWVYRSLRKRVAIGVPSAIDVLRTRSGDCNEHTQLFIALARAAGIPARGAAGLALVGGKFYYHAWPEVYLGTWVAVDPTFGQFPADAAHLRFTTGAVTRQVALLRLIGTIDISVVEASERPGGVAR